MAAKRILQHIIVFGYLMLTGAAFLYTMTRVRVPVPEVLLLWSYGMMAPYQGDTDFNDELVAEGKRPDGSWEEISLDRYFPVGHGEKNVRKHLTSFQKDHDTHLRAFREFGRQLMEKERTRGNKIESVRLTFIQWPRSPGGYEYLRQPLFSTGTFVTIVP